MYFRPLPLMTVLAVLSLAILGWLGQWQMARYFEKTAIEAAPPPAFRELALYPRLPGGARTQQVYGLFKGQSAWRRYVPVSLTPDGSVAGIAPLDVLLAVNAAPVTGEIPPLLSGRFIALDVPVGRSAFTPDDKPQEDVWFAMDAVALLRRMGAADVAGSLVYEPEQIMVRDPEGRLAAGLFARAPNPWADPAVMEELPPARHLGYALTWWGLALALIGVYLAFHHGRGRLRFRGGGSRGRGGGR